MSGVVKSSGRVFGMSCWNISPKQGSPMQLLLSRDIGDDEEPRVFIFVRDEEVVLSRDTARELAELLSRLAGEDSGS